MRDTALLLPAVFKIRPRILLPRGLFLFLLFPKTHADLLTVRRRIAPMGIRANVNYLSGNVTFAVIVSV